jgi:hypothetical protein
MLKMDKWLFRKYVQKIIHFQEDFRKQLLAPLQLKKASDHYSKKVRVI